MRCVFCEAPEGQPHKGFCLTRMDGSRPEYEPESAVVRTLASHQLLTSHYEFACTDPTCGWRFSHKPSMREIRQGIDTVGLEFSKHVATVLEPLFERERATAWDAGYLRGQYPWVREDQEEDPIPDCISPPTRGRNANPYRAQ